MIRSLKVTFDGLATIDAGAFAVMQARNGHGRGRVVHDGRRARQNARHTHI